jgi:ABC-2 type transport system ATP-binding protein
LNVDAVVAAIDVHTGYARRRRPHTVTRASFAFQAGSVVALIGPNGCGKTTMMKTLIGLIPPLQGTLTIAGRSPVDYRRQVGLGYLPEGLVLPGAWSGRGLLALMTVAANARGTAHVSSALQLAHIDFDLEQPVASLSKGMRQRLALALALTPMPDLLLLDEPEAGLDPAQRIQLRRNIREFASSGRTVVIASHDVSGLCLSADQVYLLSEQHLQRLEPSELSDASRVLHLFEQKG